MPLQGGTMADETVRHRILVVDDDARTARLLVRMLCEDGYEAELAVDGAGAIGRLARSPLPDILVTDLKLPYADGVAVARYAQSRCPRLPVFVITGHPEFMRDLEGSFDPAPVVFTKPIDYAVLSDQLSQVFAQR
jgi:two-component system response regulator MprA